jgi:hypothetical protein
MTDTARLAAILGCAAPGVTRAGLSMARTIGLPPDPHTAMVAQLAGMRIPPELKVSLMRGLPDPFPAMPPKPRAHGHCPGCQCGLVDV